MHPHEQLEFDNRTYLGNGSVMDQLRGAKAELAAIKARLERQEKAAPGDAEELSRVIDRVRGLQAAKARADKDQALIKALYNPQGATTPAYPEGAAMEFKTLGEFAAHHIARARGGVAGAKFDLSSPEFKAAAPFTVNAASSPIADYDTANVYGARRELMVADLFGAEVISGNALTYYLEGAAVEGGPAVVAEGAKKPLTSWEITPVTKVLQKVAAHYKESSELMEDAPWMASSVNSRGIHLHMLAVESFLLSELSGTSGIQAGAALDADGVFDAMTKVRAASGFPADGIVVNPADYQAMRLAKDANEQYLAGGPFYGQYGNGTIVEQPGLWGLRTVVSASVPQGTAYVGAFALGGSVVTKGGVRVDASNTNEDDFIKNVVTILIEQRLALAVRYPAAFVKIVDAGAEG